MMKASLITNHLHKSKPEAPSTSNPPKAIPTLQYRWSRDEDIDLANIVGSFNSRNAHLENDKELSAASASECLFEYFLSQIEPKNVSESLKEPSWVDVMQEELNQFARNKV
ncbi:hypothetical protein Tco_1061282 [Tanacetum coccineum]